MLSPSIVPMVSTNTRKGVWEGGFWKRVAGPEAGQHKSANARRCRSGLAVARCRFFVSVKHSVPASARGCRIRVAGQDTAQKSLSTTGTTNISSVGIRLVLFLLFLLGLSTLWGDFDRGPVEMEWY